MIKTQGAEKIVTMTCCNSRYATVAETLGHECPADDTKMFDQIIRVEEQVQAAKWTLGARATGMISSAYMSQYSADKMARDGEGLQAKLKRDRDRLFSMIDALSPDQMEAFGRYRRA